MKLSLKFSEYRLILTEQARFSQWSDSYEERTVYETIIPAHTKPFPEYPRKQEQLNEPLVLKQLAFESQVWVASAHSFTSGRVGHMCNISPRRSVTAFVMIRLISSCLHDSAFINT